MINCGGIYNVYVSTLLRDGLMMSLSMSCGICCGRWCSLHVSVRSRHVLRRGGRGGKKAAAGAMDDDAAFANYFASDN